MAHQTQDGSFTLSDDPARFDLERAHGWIGGESYWAKGIPLETFRRACANSVTIGCYDASGRMVGMARVVTDRATFGWVCDVFVDVAFRGQAIGKRLMAYLKSHPELQDFRRMHLATADAHGLYRQFGFGELTGVDRWMEIRDPDVYRR